MKMTMHIDESVLADVMELTGARSKTEAVEMALRDIARRHRQKQAFNAPLPLTPPQWEAEFAPRASDAVDTPAIDDAKLQRFLSAYHQRRTIPTHPDATLKVAEDSASHG